MLVIVMEKQIISPNDVCPGCLMADQSGQPRWHHGKLGCGRVLSRSAEAMPDQYECQMGFRVANIE